MAVCYEPFTNWLEDKMLPMLDEEVVPARAALTPSFVKHEQTNPSLLIKAEHKPSTIPDTQSLLKEFETVFDAVEMTHGTLTPPQSPTYEPFLTTLEPVATAPQAIVSMDYPPATPQPDVAHELAMVDELIRTRAENMVQCPSSPGSSCESSNFGDCSSDDPEWIPEPISSGFASEGLSKPSSHRRSKPYSRSSPEDKKSRKKEQNKNAATRYRMKKKAEVEEILGEERTLAKQNEGLDVKIEDLQREIKYLKGLMRDLFKAKGLIN